MAIITSDKIKKLTNEELKLVFNSKSWEELPPSLVTIIKEYDFKGNLLNRIERLASTEVTSRFINGKIK